MKRIWNVAAIIASIGCSINGIVDIYNHHNVGWAVFWVFFGLFVLAISVDGFKKNEW
jgi:hypothetical protein